jgi:hypothetical protein
MLAAFVTLALALNAPSGAVRRSALAPRSAARAAARALDLLGGGASKTAWTQVNIPVESILFDIEFDATSPDHGWIVGNKGTFLETTDGARARAGRRAGGRALERARERASGERGNARA